MNDATDYDDIDDYNDGKDYDGDSDDSDAADNGETTGDGGGDENDVVMEAIISYNKHKLLTSRNCDNSPAKNISYKN